MCIQAHVIHICGHRSVVLNNCPFRGTQACTPQLHGRSYPGFAGAATGRGGALNVQQRAQAGADAQSDHNGLNLGQYPQYQDALAAATAAARSIPANTPAAQVPPTARAVNILSQVPLAPIRGNVNTNVQTPRMPGGMNTAGSAQPRPAATGRNVFNAAPGNNTGLMANHHNSQASSRVSNANTSVRSVKIGLGSELGSEEESDNTETSSDDGAPGSVPEAAMTNDYGNSFDRDSSEDGDGVIDINRVFRDGGSQDSRTAGVDIENSLRIDTRTGIFKLGRQWKVPVSSEIAQSRAGPIYGFVSIWSQHELEIPASAAQVESMPPEHPCLYHDMLTASAPGVEQSLYSFFHNHTDHCTTFQSTTPSSSLGQPDEPAYPDHGNEPQKANDNVAEQNVEQEKDDDDDEELYVVVREDSLLVNLSMSGAC
ncbi:hypothetical protein F4861DRAFT_548430 [Xylaria intraflava]|nr:hypothetical protein F4861DRAFT_548430 [Xylaria intraflava]